MANKSCLLFLSLVLMAVLVSAHRPLVADRKQASESSSLTKMDTNANLMGNDGNINDIGNQNEMGASPGVFVGAPGVSVGVPGMSMGAPGMSMGAPGVSVGVPGMSMGVPGMSMGAPGVSVGVPGMSMGAPGMSMGAPGVSVGAPGVSVGVPISFPGSDGQFQFQIGPIGFGWTWNVGISPGPLMSYSQPIVVSPYSPPSAPPSYANVQPYQQQPGAFLPLPRYFGPFPVGGYIPGSFGSYFPDSFRQSVPGSNQMQAPAAGHK